jgi:beta-lactamase superfamily II metal-dependent hydrolase
MALKKRPAQRVSVSNAKTPPAKRRSASRPPTSKISRAAAGAAPTSSPRARIRVYRHGLGDCILVRLSRQTEPDFKILIDCGVAVAMQNSAAIMTKVVEDVVRTTGGKIDVLAVTHEHWDHVSGFAQAEEAFKKLEVGEVWVAWTEDPDDDLAKSLRKDHARALAVLDTSVRAMTLAGQGDRASAIKNILGLAGAAGEKTAAAFDKAKAMGRQRAKPRYWQPDDTRHAPNQQTAPIRPANSDVTIYALGPPYDPKLIRKTLPSKRDPETYELKLDSSNGFPAGVLKVLLGAEDTLPFSGTVRIPMKKARTLSFFQDNYWGSGGKDADWRRIDADWLGATDELALAMQSATNNTSLVLAVELAGGDVLLFAGDAQVGNWRSWQDRKWTVDGRVVTGPDLLARTIFYKVGHHGSHNATLKEQGLEMMKNLQTAAIPVDEIVAKKMSWGAMPLKSLVAELGSRTKGRTLRTDIAPSVAMSGITVEDLYYEFEV